jgi:hypothetical protein
MVAMRTIPLREQSHNRRVTQIIEDGTTCQIWQVALKHRATLARLTVAHYTILLHFRQTLGKSSLATSDKSDRLCQAATRR